MHTLNKSATLKVVKHPFRSNSVLILNPLTFLNINKIVLSAEDSKKLFPNADPKYQIMLKIELTFETNKKYKICIRFRLQQCHRIISQDNEDAIKIIGPRLLAFETCLLSILCNMILDYRPFTQWYIPCQYIVCSQRQWMMHKKNEE